MRRRLDVVAVGLLAVVGYMAVLHAVAFRTLLGSPDPVITGRYLLALLPLYGVTIALANGDDSVRAIDPVRRLVEW